MGWRYIPDGCGSQGSSKKLQTYAPMPIRLTGSVSSSVANPHRTRIACIPCTYSLPTHDTSSPLCICTGEHHRYRPMRLYRWYTGVTLPSVCVVVHPSHVCMHRCHTGRWHPSGAPGGRWLVHTQRGRPTPHPTRWGRHEDPPPTGRRRPGRQVPGPHVIVVYCRLSYPHSHIMCIQFRCE